MKKRTFLKTSSLFLTGSLLAPHLACDTPQPAEESPEPLRNWAGNLRYSTGHVQAPKTPEAVQSLVRQDGKVRALGSRHSFNAIADSQHQLLSTENLNQVIELDAEARTLTVQAGARYGDICEYLHEQGFALGNLASLPHISIAGACATATHGSGVKNGGLATSVRALEFVNGKGEVVKLSREQDGDTFAGAVVGLGALGVVTQLTLDLLPTFEMQQSVYRKLPMQALESDFEAIMSSGYSVSLFTDWASDTVNQVWIKSRSDADSIVSGPDFYGATLADKDLHPVETQSAESCTEQQGQPGPWYARLPHFKMGFTPSSGDELQAEYFVPLEQGYAAMQAVAALGDQISPHLFISEIRTIAADDLWMSPCYQQPCVAIHFTFKPEPEAVNRLMPLIEKVLSPKTVRPHWGKLFRLEPAVLQSRIARLADFKALVAAHDPEGKFRNEFLEKNLWT